MVDGGGGCKMPVSYSDCNFETTLKSVTIKVIIYLWHLCDPISSDDEEKGGGNLSGSFF